MAARKAQSHAKRAREFALKEKRELKRAKKADRAAGIIETGEVSEDETSEVGEDGEVEASETGEVEAGDSAVAEENAKVETSEWIS